MKFSLFGRDPAVDKGGINGASISDAGEVIIREFDYSEFNTQLLDTVDVAFNHFKPKDGFRFVITGLSLAGNRDIGVNGSIYSLYTATSATSTVIVDEPFTAEVPKSSLSFGPIPQVRIAKGVFLNSKCDDNNIRVTVYGYFVPVG